MAYRNGEKQFVLDEPTAHQLIRVYILEDWYEGKVAVQPDWISCDESWKQEALCKNLTQFFYLENKGKGFSQQRKIDKMHELCTKCPVSEQCLKYALDNEEEYGYWGGIDFEAERKAKRNKAKKSRKKQC
jgi:WhiB family redox-sensing transcriptional regulator